MDLKSKVKSTKMELTIAGKFLHHRLLSQKNRTISLSKVCSLLLNSHNDILEAEEVSQESEAQAESSQSIEESPESVESSTEETVTERPAPTPDPRFAVDAFANKHEDL